MFEIDPVVGPDDYRDENGTYCGVGPFRGRPARRSQSEGGGRGRGEFGDFRLCCCAKAVRDGFPNKARGSFARCQAPCI